MQYLSLVCQAGGVSPRSLLLVCLLLAGCSRSPDSKNQGPRYPEALRSTATAFAAAPPAPVQYQGVTASQWTERLDAPDLSIREEASAALAALKEQGLPHLLEGMRHSAWEVRLACLQAVHKPVLTDHAGEALPLLTQMLKDPNPLVRQQAAYRLSWFGDQARSALPLLERLAASDASEDVRATAADVVVEMNESLTQLLRLLQDRNPLVRERAAQNLGGLEQHARSALPALEHLAASDGDPAVRAAAGQAVESINRALTNVGNR